jgi:hypothetical protein
VDCVDEIVLALGVEEVVVQRLDLAPPSRVTEPAGSAAQIDGQRRERPIARRCRTGIDQAAVEPDFALAVRGELGQHVVGERERPRREVVRQHALALGPVVIGVRRQVNGKDMQRNAGGLRMVDDVDRP